MHKYNIKLYNFSNEHIKRLIYNTNVEESLKIVLDTIVVTRFESYCKLCIDMLSSACGRNSLTNYEIDDIYSNNNKVINRFKPMHNMFTTLPEYERMVIYYCSVYDLFYSASKVEPNSVFGPDFYEVIYYLLKETNDEGMYLEIFDILESLYYDILNNVVLGQISELSNHENIYIYCNIFNERLYIGVPELG